MSKNQYLLSVHGGDDVALPDDFDIQSVYQAVDDFNQEVRTEGAWVFAGGLLPASSATVVDATGAEVAITDGPYLESKEHLGGFWVIEADDLDAALAYARRGSVACQGPVEVRPFAAE